MRIKHLFLLGLISTTSLLAIWTLLSLVRLQVIDLPYLADGSSKKVEYFVKNSDFVFFHDRTKNNIVMVSKASPENSVQVVKELQFPYRTLFAGWAEIENGDLLELVPPDACKYSVIITPYGKGDFPEFATEFINCLSELPI